MSYSINGPVPRQYVAVLGDVKLTGPSPSHVLQKWAVLLEERGYRLEPGWEQSVWEALMKSHPKHIKRKRGKPKFAGVSVAAAASFLRFMAKRATDKSLVTPELAKTRAEACWRCPNRAPVLGCHICKDALQLTVKPPEHLHAPEACSACGCYLPLKLWLPRHQLGPAEAFPYWDQCWMRAEPEE